MVVRTTLPSYLQGFGVLEILRVPSQSYTVEARKLEHHSPHALKVKYRGS